MAKVEDVSFLGASRAVYKFRVYTLDRTFRDIGAVYLFSCTNAKGQHQPLYIGQTDKLGNRIQNHNKWPRLRQNGVECICVRVDDDERSRISTTADLTAYYNPPCN